MVGPVALSQSKHRPGEIRDAILEVLRESPRAMSVQEIAAAVSSRLLEVPDSSVRSYLSLNTPALFERPKRAHYSLREQQSLYFGPGERSPRPTTSFRFRDSVLHNDDCFNWLSNCVPRSIHAVVTDPPYGLVEYSKLQQEKLRAKRGASGAYHLLSMVQSDRPCRDLRF
jgi:hypothetical protein